MGHIYAQLGHYDQALIFYTNSLTLAQANGDAVAVANALIDIGYIYAELGEYAEAQQHYLRGAQQARGLSDNTEARALNNLAAAWIETGDYTSALQELTSSLVLARKSGDPQVLNAVLDSLADVYLRLGKADQALVYSNESVRLARGIDPSVGENLVTLGKIHLYKGDTSLALACFQEAAQISEEKQSQHQLVYAWLMQGVAYRQLKRTDIALALIQRATDLAAAQDSRPLHCECLQELSLTCQAMGEFESALLNFQRFHTLKEKIFNERSDMRLKTLQVLHQLESARKEAELYLLRNVELQREVEERQKTELALAELATKDPLTGVYNRRQFFLLGEKLVEQATANQHPLAAIMFDIDHFKIINDTYGHIAGDRVLRGISDHINAELRRADLVARFGGDEFAILLPEANEIQAWQVAERLRERIALSAFLDPSIALHITASLGIAQLGSGEDSIDTLIERADKALYTAKQTGRNRVAG